VTTDPGIAAGLVARRRQTLACGAVVAGAATALVGAYLFWTGPVVTVRGVPLAGGLRNYGFGGPRLYVALVAVAAGAHAGMLLARRTRGGEPAGVARALTALTALGLALVAVPVLWAFTLVFFDKQSVTVIGPGPVVVLAGGLIVTWATTGRRRSAPIAGAEPDPAPGPWPRRSPLIDAALVVGTLLAAFVVFLCGVGTAPPGSPLAPFAATDASAFIGYLGATAGLAVWLTRLGLFAGLAGPFARLRIVAIATSAVLLVAFPLTQGGSTTWVHVAAQAALFVVAALGLNIVVGSAGLLDLGYVAFVAIGAYVAALTGTALLTNHNVPLPFAFVLFVAAPAVAAVFGVLLGAPTLRLRGDYLAVVTLGFGEIVRIALNNLEGLTRGPNGISSIPDPGFGDWGLQNGIALGGLTLAGDALYLYLGLALVVVVLVANRRVGASRIGRAWVAIREDEVAAAAMGINTTALKLLAFASGAFFAGMAGSVQAHLGTQVSPDSYTFEVSVLILAMVVLGGIGNPAGVVLGAVLLTFLPEKLRDFSDVRFLLFGVALVLVMRFRPEGLLPSARRRAELHATGEEAHAEIQELRDVTGA
jgi:branched-chain amino acid transport system permease protein